MTLGQTDFHTADRTKMANYEQAAVELAKAAPPVAVTSMTFAGYPLSDWLLVLTAIYTVLQIVIAVRRFLTARRRSDLPAAVHGEDPPCADDCPAVNRRRR